MLVVISDLHLGDGTTAASIPASAFYLFAKRLRQDAHFASVQNGKYHPITELDVILMGEKRASAAEVCTAAFSPLLVELRTDPRFQALLARMGLQNKSVLGIRR